MGSILHRTQLKEISPRHLGTDFAPSLLAAARILGQSRTRLPFLHWLYSIVRRQHHSAQFPRSPHRPTFTPSSPRRLDNSWGITNQNHFRTSDSLFSSLHGQPRKSHRECFSLRRFGAVTRQELSMQPGEEGTPPSPVSFPRASVSSPSPFPLSPFLHHA
jgi:hypothetical protein